MAVTSRQAGVLLIAALTAVAARAATEPPAGYTRARDAGCVICHEVQASSHGPNEVIPVAPTLEDVACRYRSDPNAPARLSSTVIHGSGPSERDRHWAGQVSFQKMFPNDLIVNEDEAREIVDWIMTLCPRPPTKQSRRGG